MSDTTTALDEMLAALHERTEDVAVFGPMQGYKTLRTAKVRAERDAEWAASAGCTVDIVRDYEPGLFVVGLVQPHPVNTVRTWLLRGTVAPAQVRL